ncbi:hypothetical protein A8C32_03545 [Flavivirga aquatica]|uniref:Alpha-L-glutamate ligase-related protein ATP-grasp domain-containing protein n=1 Tax=Flavivirga aquatica TaxID=1849968 RepID=A0A1E5TAZ9_9FLAO|nr:sugar-transfer associated ATP-grasp domain-containing protein [Flavivirga aquatica]OEK08540.1 hypothetical protein A8C32_03545 [Flavivirga aquatica]
MLSRIKYIKVFFNDPDKKNYLKILIELLHFAWIKKEIPSDYFRKFLYRTDVLDYKNYLSLNQYYKIISHPEIRLPEIASILNNKLSFAHYSENNNLPTPTVISYNLRNNFFFNNEITTIFTKEDIVLFFEKIFKKTNNDKLFLKLLEGYGGHGYILLDESKLIDQIKTYGNSMLKTSYIHQELVIQHPDINKIYSNSINTLRIDTYIDKKLEAHVLSALIRFGSGNSHVDNTSGGGYSISINADSGKLQGKLRQDVTKGGRVHTKHPDSNVILEDYKIPFFEEACLLAKQASKNLPNRIIGWDIAITKNGPVIIEGNEGPSLHMTDVAYGGYCKHPIIQELLLETNK